MTTPRYRFLDINAAPVTEAQPVVPRSPSMIKTVQPRDTEADLVAMAGVHRNTYAPDLFTLKDDDCSDGGCGLCKLF